MSGAPPPLGSPGTDWQALGQGTLNGRIRHEIMRVLAERQLSPGDRLPSERELAAALHVSRPSVREAVRSLEAEGRLVVRHGQGVFVAEPDARRRMRESMVELDHNLGELFAMRELLEVPAARWAARRQDLRALASARHAYEELEAALAQHPLDYDRLQKLDAAFHFQIVRASGNRLLEQTQAVLHDLMAQGMQTTLEVQGRLRQSSEDHGRILAALLAGDADAAAQAAQQHVYGARDAANRRLAAVTAEDAELKEAGLPD